MKKTVLMMAIFAIGFVGCKKSDDVIQPLGKPALSKSIAWSDQTLISGGTVKSGQYLYVVQPGVENFWAGPQVNISGTMALSNIVSMYLQVVKASDTNVVIGQSLPASPVFASNGFSAIELASGTAYLWRVYIKTKLGSTGTLTTSLTIRPQWTNGTNEPSTVAGQTMTFVLSAASTILTSVNPSSALGQYVTGNQEFEVMKLDVVSIGGSSMLTQEKFKVNAPYVAWITPLITIKVYDGLTMVGSGTISGSNPATATVSLSNLSLTENVVNTLSVKVVIGSIGMSSIRGNFDITSDNISYIDAGGASKINDNDLTSSKFFLIRSTQVITSVPLSGILQNGVLGDRNKLTILSLGENSATKQLTYKVKLIDNGTHVDSIAYKNFYLKVNGVIMTNVRFTNTLGQVIDSIGPGEHIIRVTFVSGLHEYVNPKDILTDYALGGRFTGYNHQLEDGDIGSIELIATDAPSAYHYVNSGTAPDNLSAKLFSSPGANAGAIVQNYIWSHMAAGIPHSLAFGSSTEDAENASVGVKDNTYPQVWR